MRWISVAVKSKLECVLARILLPIYQQYEAKKYKVAVFLAGSRDLAEETVALLRCIKRRIAELEVQRERKRRKSMAR